MPTLELMKSQPFETHPWTLVEKDDEILDHTEDIGLEISLLPVHILQTNPPKVANQLSKVNMREKLLNSITKQQDFSLIHHLIVYLQQGHKSRPNIDIGLMQLPKHPVNQPFQFSQIHQRTGNINEYLQCRIRIKGLLKHHMIVPYGYPLQHLQPLHIHRTQSHQYPHPLRTSAMHPTLRER